MLLMIRESAFVYSSKHSNSNPLSSMKNPCWQGTLKEVVSAVFWRDVLMEVVATMILLLAQCILPLSWGKDPPYGSLLQVGKKHRLKRAFNLNGDTFP